jgi:ubiquinone/menaquinone biosynthesis C-methylase UbiE
VTGAQDRDRDHDRGRYTHGHEAAALAAHGARTVADSAAYLLDRLKPGLSLLDVGCGPGSITLDFARLIAPGLAVGLEPVEAPLNAARALAEARGDQSTRFMVGEVMALPFADDAFDIVHAHQVLQHLTDPVGALREMARVCRPDGWIAVRDADYAAMAWSPETPELEAWRTLYRAIARANGAEPDAGRHLRSWALAAGLRDITITTSNWTYADEAACGDRAASQADRILGDVFMGQALEQGVAKDEVRAMAKAWRRWGEAPDAFFLIPNTEILARPPKD